MTFLPPDIYVLDDIPNEKVEVIRSDTGAIFIHCSTILSPLAAKQLQYGLAAVLSGTFSRAISEAEFRFDLERRTPSSSVTTPTPRSSIKPELDML